MHKKGNILKRLQEQMKSNHSDSEGFFINLLNGLKLPLSNQL